MSRYDEFRDILKGNVEMPGWSPSTRSTGRMRNFPRDIDAMDHWLYDKGAHTGQGFGEDERGLDIMTSRMLEHGIYDSPEEIDAEWEGSRYEMGEYYANLPDPARQSIEIKNSGFRTSWSPVEGERGATRGPDLDRWEDRIARSYEPTRVEPTDLRGIRFQVGTSSSPLSVMRGRGAEYDNSVVRVRDHSLTTPTMVHELGHHGAANVSIGRTERLRSHRAPIGDTRTSPEEEGFADEWQARLHGSGPDYRGGPEYRRSAQWRDRYEGTREMIGAQFEDVMHEFRGR